MYATRLALLSLTSLLGCQNELVPIPGVTFPDGSCPTQPDMATPAAKCAAAKGLSGTNLLCVDFSKVNQLSELPGWDFTNTAKCPGWMLSQGKLQINNFSSLMMGNCQFVLPTQDFNDSDKKTYNSATLSLIQKIDINENDEIAQIFLGNDISARQLWRASGTSPRQITTFNINRADLPTGLASIYPFIFKLTAGNPGTSVQNWFIESIAINGVP